MIEKYINFFSSSVDNLIAIKENTIKALSRIKIYTVRDLLFYRPKKYYIVNIGSKIRTLSSGSIIQTYVVIQNYKKKYVNRKLIHSLLCNVDNETDLELIFFNKIPNFIDINSYKNRKIQILGTLVKHNNNYRMIHPDFIFYDNMQYSVRPIYNLTYSLSNIQIYYYVIRIIDLLKNLIDSDYKLVKSTQEKEIIDFIRELYVNFTKMHFLKSSEHNVMEHIDSARMFFALQEVVNHQNNVNQLKKELKKNQGNAFNIRKDLQEIIMSKLDFELTNDQEYVIQEIERDQKSAYQMNRLLQGDVGCGKTLVALMTILNVISQEGCNQVALMCPTDLLSTQHYNFFVYALSSFNFKVSLLTGKTSAKDTKQILYELKQGQIDVIIGTHSLFQDRIEFKNLSYIIIDEQHKFGVNQRMSLIQKASCPDVLIMTATPIPRSLCLAFFGDMDISSIKTKPINRKPIITKVMNNSARNNIIQSIEKIISNEEQVYWLCPAIDSKDEDESQIEHNLENKKLNLITIDEIYQKLIIKFPNITGRLHGKMTPAEKDDVNSNFLQGKIKILVTTTVVEVGINVPNATVIVIENAESFGLAQLHQLRGRVGRGEKQSYCIMLYDIQKMNQTSKKRLDIIKNHYDGFAIAEQDMLIRGQGDISGTKQSGEIDFFFLDLMSDMHLVLKANDILKNQQYSIHILNLQDILFSRMLNLKLVKENNNKNILN